MAVKLLSPEHSTPQMVERFRHEARLLGRIQHGAVIKGGPPLWLACVEGSPSREGAGPMAAFVMDYVAGSPLSRWTEAGMALPPTVALSVIARVAGVMHHVHHQEEDGRPLGVVHRDLKPSNVMIERGGDVRILDLGIARANLTFISQRQATVGVIGTPGYIAPEQVERLWDESNPAAGDVYALGVMLHELLTGRHPSVRAHQAPPPEAVDGLALAAVLRDVEPHNRPDFREVARRAEALARGAEGPSLADWCEREVPAEPALTTDSMTGALLQEVDGAASLVRSGLPGEATRVEVAAPPQRGALVAPGTAGLAIGALAMSLSGGPSEPDPAVAPPAPTPAVYEEPALADAGRFPAVVRAGGCSGVIVAPGVVLMHRSCVRQPAIATLQGAAGEKLRLEVASHQESPYHAAAMRPVSSGVPRPLAQRAGPDGVNVQVLFIPGLTPALLGGWGVVPATLTAQPFGQDDFALAANTVTLVDTRRVWSPLTVLDSRALTLEDPTLLFLLYGSCAGETCLSRAGSAGVSLGARPLYTPLLETKEAGGPVWIREPDERAAPRLDHVVIGLHPIEDAPASGTPADAGWQPFAPLARLATSSRDQAEAARINAGWVRYVMSDPDRDGVVATCEAPESAGPLCPAPVGLPPDLKAVSPRALLTCPSGFVASGLRGRQGILLDQIQLLCRPAGCVAADRGRCREAWSDTYGNEGGDPFFSACHDDEVMTGVVAGVRLSSASVAGGWVDTLRPVCTSIRELRGGGGASPAAGLRPWWDAEPHETVLAICGPGGAVVGLVASSTDEPRLVSGLQPVCSYEPRDVTVHVGGIGGEDVPLSCPPGTVARGTVQAPTLGAVGLFGLLCGPLTPPEDGRPTPEIVVHGTWAATPGGEEIHLPATVRLTDLEPRMPAGGVVARCPGGRALTGLDVHATLIITQLRSITCGPAGGGEVVVPVGVGEAVGAAHTLRCARGSVTGTVANTTGFLEGLSLTCGVAP